MCQVRSCSTTGWRASMTIVRVRIGEIIAKVTMKVYDLILA